MPPTTSPDDTTSSFPAPQPSPLRTIRPPRSLPSSRAAVGGLLVAVAAIGTWFAAAGGGGSTTERYVVTRRSVAPGVALTRDDLALAEVDLPDRLRLRAFADPADLVGTVARAPLGAGELVQAGAVGATGNRPGDVELSFSVDPAWAVAGDLEVGDRIAVYATDDDGRTEVVLDDVHVRRITAPDVDGFGSDGTQTITVTSGDPAAVAVAVAATRTADITVVRVTEEADR
jgi:hypothetical protein